MNTAPEHRGYAATRVSAWRWTDGTRKKESQDLCVVSPMVKPVLRDPCEVHYSRVRKPPLNTKQTSKTKKKTPRWVMLLRCFPHQYGQQIYSEDIYASMNCKPAKTPSFPNLRVSQKNQMSDNILTAKDLGAQGTEKSYLACLRPQMPEHVCGGHTHTGESHLTNEVLFTCFITVWT